MRSDLLGLDTETKPVFKRGHTNKVGLLQVSTRELCFLFRLNIIGIPDSVATLLENKDIPLIGLSLHDDVLALRKRREFTPGNFVDLQKIVGKIGIEDLSLQKLYANLFHQKISKRQRLTNWEAKELTEKQQGYAATDAWACIMLYEEINRLNDTQDYNLIPSPKPKEEEVKEEVLAEEIKQ
jgi:ribonuclease D